MEITKSLLFKIINGGVIIAALTIGYKYNSLNNQYNDLVLQHEQLKGEYAVAKANVQTLENSIQVQNLSIEKYKQESDTFQQQIKELNEQVLKEKELEYISVDKQNTTAEEAIEWLRKQSSLLVY